LKNGITKEVVLTVSQLGTVKDPWGNQRIAFEAHDRDRYIAIDYRCALSWHIGNQDVLPSTLTQIY
jgi:hypothetical protein